MTSTTLILTFVVTTTRSLGNGFEKTPPRSNRSETGMVFGTAGGLLLVLDAAPFFPSIPSLMPFLSIQPGILCVRDFKAVLAEFPMNFIYPLFWLQFPPFET